MNKFWTFIGNMFSSGSNTSSKRVNGTIGFIVIQIIVLFAVIYDIIKDGALSSIVSHLVEIDLYTSVGLLGLGNVMEGIKTKLSK